MARLLPLIAAVVLAAAAGGCGTGHAGGTPATTLPPTAVPSTTAASSTAVPSTTGAPSTAPASTGPRSTPTTERPPPSPQPSPDAAATVFVQAWKAGDRKGAAAVGTTRAVAALFAHPYQGQTVIDRGCSDSFLPRVCSWGDYGGGSGPLYEIDTRPTGSGWYVSDVSVEV